MRRFGAMSRRVHHHRRPLLTDSRQRLQQIDHLDVGEHVVAGGRVERLTEAEFAGAHLALQFGAATPRIRGRRASGFELLRGELGNGHESAFVRFGWVRFWAQPSVAAVPRAPET